MAREVAKRATGKGPAFDLAQAKWRSSGITDDHAGLLHFKGLEGNETGALASNFHAARSLFIPYFDLKGNPTDFYRIRYLEKLPGFAGTVEKPQRYAQPKATINEVYFPPLLPTPWEDIADDPNVTVYFTEGELKSACACGHGLACVGLGGVDVWRSTKHSIEILPALGEFVWKGRPVVIVYDSDAATNPNVVRAQRKLAAELTTRGAQPAIASLPSAKDGGKQGLDDFIVAHGPEALLQILCEADPFTEAEALWELNEEVVYVRDPGIIVVRDSGQRIDPGKFAAHAYANRHYTVKESAKDGHEVLKHKKLAPRWIEWEHRHELRGITYAPGKTQIWDDQWNCWPGWGCQPKKGDVSPWLWLLDFLFKGQPESRKWFEQWCAYPIQHPGAKMYSSSVIWGRAKGTGKTFLAYALMGIYGRNAIEIKNKHLKGGFNAWQENKQFIYGDEIGGNSEVTVKKIDAEWLKGLITQKEVTINQKFLPEYTIPDVMNYFFSSQWPDAFFVDDGDRRYFIHEVVGERADQPFYERLDQWLGLRQGVYHGSGREHLFHHLLQLDLKGFNPLAHAPMTMAKQAMILTGKSDVGMWCVQLREDPIRSLAPLGEDVAAGCDLFAPNQLLHAYDPEKKGKVASNGLARELKRNGFRQVNEESPIRTQLGTIRIYCVRNPEKWLRASTKEIADHFNKFFGSGTKKYN